MVVHLDLRVGFEVIRHQHNRNLDVTEFIYLKQQQQQQQAVKVKENDSVMPNDKIIFEQWCISKIAWYLFYRRLLDLLQWINQTVFLFTENYLQYRGHSSNVVHWWTAAKKQLPFTNSSSEKLSCLHQQAKHYLFGRTVHFLFFIALNNSTHVKWPFMGNSTRMTTHKLKSVD